MEARKFATQMAAICPFALILGMGYSVRQPVPGHHVLQYSDAQNARLEAYRPIASYANPLQLGPGIARREAERWNRLGRAVKLQALTPAYEEEMFEDNARGEIITQWRAIQQQLNRDMRHELDEGQLSLAAEDGIRLIRLNEILKYSDFQTLHLATTTTTHAVALIGSRITKLRAEDRRAFNAAVSAVNRNRGKLPTLYKVMKANFEAYTVRRIGFGRELGGELGLTVEDDAISISVETGALQRAYVLAVRDEAKFRAEARTFLGLTFNPSKS